MDKVRNPRRTGLVALALALVAGTALVAPGPVTAGQGAVDGLVDLEVALTSTPGTVSPAGSLVLYTATVTQGTLPTAGTLTIDLPGGAAYRDDLSSPSCDGGPTTVVCEVDPAPGTFEVVASTPLALGTYTATATVAATDPPVGTVEYDQDNTATATTAVTAPQAGVAAGLVEEGESLSLVLDDGRAYTLSVPQGVPGVITIIRAEDGGARTCGAGGCGDGFVNDFVSHPTFKAEDPTNPLRADLTFGPQPPCRGLGGTCSEIFVAKSPEAPVLTVLPPCPGASGGEAGNGTAVPSPCLNQRYKVDGVVQFDVRLLSNDPMLLPPLRG